MSIIGARLYWKTESAAQLAFTRVSALGLLRLLTNHTVMQDQPFAPAEAWAAYAAFRVLPEVLWIGENGESAARADAHLADWAGASTFSATHWTDGHLAALALVSGCRIVSFDGGFRRYTGLSFLRLS